MRLSGIGEYHIYRLFPEGEWTEVRELAGIERHSMDLDLVTDEQLIEEFSGISLILGMSTLVDDHGIGFKLRGPPSGFYGTAQYQATSNQLVAQGYRLELVSGYSVGGQDRIAAIWTK